MDEPTLEESLAQLIGKVPAPIQQYILNDLAGEVRVLMGKYQLHVDQGGLLQTELLLMLLGQEEPAEFMKALRDTGIGEGTVQSLMVDVNEQVFKPLRKQEQSEGTAPAPRPAPAPVKVEEPRPAIQPAPDTGARTMESDMQAAQAFAQYQAPQHQPGSQTQTYWVPVSITATPQPYITTQPPTQSYIPPPAPVAPPPPPPIEQPKVEVEQPIPPPPPLPVQPERPWQPAPPPNLPTAPTPNTPIHKEFGADPYREPV